MKMIALGSTAMSYYYRLRHPKDLDVVISFDDLSKFQEQFKLVSLEPRSVNKFHGRNEFGYHYEIEVADIKENSSTDLIYKMVDEFPVDKNGFSIPPIALLYQIKLCHQYKFSPHFEKTRNDILFMRGLVSETIMDEWKPFLEARKTEASRKTPKLNVTTGEFFVDTYGDVDQIVHDTIHLTQAFGDKPAYLNFQLGEVQCSMKRFFELDEQIRLNAVFEESATLAIERAIWPTQFKCNEFKAFRTSLQKLCCHISSGKFRAYAWDNYNEVLAMYKKGDIVKRFREGLEDGTIEFQKDKTGETV